VLGYGGIGDCIVPFYGMRGRRQVVTALSALCIPPRSIGA
jgi:hypothetical protein